MPIKFYSSAAECVADTEGRRASNFSDLGRLNWYNGETLQRTKELALSGDVRLVPQAEALMHKLETQIPTERRLWEPNVAGAFCSVPDYLSGRPTSMRRQVVIQEDHQPINIFAAGTCSFDIKAKTMQERGIVILALVMALTRVRPVSLYLLQTGDGSPDGESVFAVKINTAPLDLARACYMLTSVGFTRRILYGLGRALHDFTGSWPYRAGFNYHNPQPYYEALKLRMGLDPKRTLIIPGAQSGDALLSDSISWVNSQVKHFTQNEERLPA